MSPDPIAVSPAEAATLLGVSRKTIYVLCDDKEIDSHYIGRLRRVSYQSLRDYFDRMPTHKKQAS